MITGGETKFSPVIRGAVKKFCPQAVEKSKKDPKNSKKNLLGKEQNLLFL